MTCPRVRVYLYPNGHCEDDITVVTDVHCTSTFPPIRQSDDGRASEYYYAIRFGFIGTKVFFDFRSHVCRNTVGSRWELGYGKMKRPGCVRTVAACTTRLTKSNTFRKSRVTHNTAVIRWSRFELFCRARHPCTSAIRLESVDLKN
jgi:hypothetical protein